MVQFSGGLCYRNILILVIWSRENGSRFANACRQSNFSCKLRKFCYKSKHWNSREFFAITWIKLNLSKLEAEKSDIRKLTVVSLIGCFEAAPALLGPVSILLGWRMRQVEARGHMCSGNTVWQLEWSMDHNTKHREHTNHTPDTNKNTHTQNRSMPMHLNRWVQFTVNKVHAMQ